MSDQIKPSPRLCRGCTNLSESHRFFALLTWIGQNSPETKGSKIRKLKMHSFGRLHIARLCFTVKLIHRETEKFWRWIMPRETGSSKRHQLSLEDRSWAAHLPGLKVSSCGMQNIVARFVISLFCEWSKSVIRSGHIPQALLSEDSTERT